MNHYHGLNWRFTDLSDTVEFMDLKLYIQDGKIYSSLYEKALNHHLIGRTEPMKIFGHLPSIMPSTSGIIQKELIQEWHQQNCSLVSNITVACYVMRGCGDTRPMF
jgi:hypothetical protein